MPKHLLKPGETLGDPVPGAPAKDQDQLLLRDGEELGLPTPTGTISAEQPSGWQLAKRTIANSAIGHAIESGMPKVADALGLHPNETVYSPTYEAHKEQLIAPDEVVPPSAHSRTANVARGVLQGAGGLTSGQSLTMIAASAATAGLLSPAVPAISRLISLGFTVQGANDLVQRVPALLNAQDDEEFYQELGRTGFDTAMIVNMAKHAAGKDSFNTWRARKVGPYADLVDPIGQIEPDAATIKRAADTKVPGFATKATEATVNAAGRLYDRFSGAAAEAGRGMARKAGEVSADALMNFAGGMKDAVVDRISESLRSALENLRPDETPEQSAGNLKDLRAKVAEALKDTGLPEEVIRDINDQVIDAYFIEKHSVSGGMGKEWDDWQANLSDEQRATDAAANQAQADMLSKYAEDGKPNPQGTVQPPPEHYRTLRDLGYSDSQVQKMSPEERVSKAAAREPLNIMDRARNLAREIANAIEPPEGMSRQAFMKMQAAKGFYKGSVVGGLAGMPFGKTVEGMVAGGVGGAAYGTGAELAKATAKVLTEDYGFKPPEAAQHVADFYRDVVHSKVGNAIDAVVSKHAQVAQKMGEVGYNVGVHVGSAVRHAAEFATNQIGQALGSAVEAARNAKSAVEASAALDKLRSTTREILAKAKVPFDVANHIVDRVAEEWWKQRHQAEDAPGPGAAGPIKTDWIRDTVLNAFESVKDSAEAAKDAVFRTPTGTTAVAEAAKLPGGIGDEVAAAATKGQLLGGGTLAFENFLRKRGAAGKFLHETYDAQGKAMAESVAQKIVDQITGKHMDSAEAGEFLQDTLRQAGTEAQQGLLNVLHQVVRQSPDGMMRYSPTELSEILDTVQKFDDTLYRSSGIKALHDSLKSQGTGSMFEGPQNAIGNSRVLLRQIGELREGLVSAWQRGALDQFQMRDVTSRLDRFIANALEGENAKLYGDAAERARNFTDMTYSEVYRAAMKADPDLVFDKMIDSTTKGEFLSLLQAVGEHGLPTIRQGLAQRILERSISPDGVLHIDDLKSLTDKNKGKLGEQYQNLNILHKGLAEMEKTWKMSEAGMNAGSSLLGSGMAKAVFAIAGALLGHGTLVGALSGLGLEMGVEAAAGFAAKVAARYLMKPGALTELNAFMRMYSNMSQRVPSSTLDSFADRIAKDVRKAADKAANYAGRKIEQHTQRQTAPRPSPAK